MSEYNEKLIPLKRQQAALVWALGDRPVYAMVNGLVREITPVSNAPCRYGHDRWSCRVLEDDSVAFYLGMEVGT